jgi:hypothetical protein
MPQERLRIDASVLCKQQTHCFGATSLKQNCSGLLYVEVEVTSFAFGRDEEGRDEVHLISSNGAVATL